VMVDMRMISNRGECLEYFDLKVVANEKWGGGREDGKCLVPCSHVVIDLLLSLKVAAILNVLPFLLHSSGLNRPH
jgi:hypothetical protein